jgi:Holliday junction resolvase-like predicted endonuclease
MLPRHLVLTTLRTLDWLAVRTLPPDKIPAHQLTGRRGEEAAYFYLRKLGYTMVAQNFRSPRCRGEIDLIGWDKDVLCFVEVKTRTTHDVKPGEAAVDRHKREKSPPWFAIIFVTFHLRANGASMSSAYTMTIQEPASRRSNCFAIPL